MNIFLDTSIFVQQNFFRGKKLENLGKLANQGLINLYITTINDKEVNKKIIEECDRLKETESSFLRKLETTHKIVKNLYDLEDFNEFITENLIEDLLEKYEKFKEFSKIKIIKTSDYFDIDSIINDYFLSKPPFSDIKNKKSEFPDAISLKIIIEYLELHKIDAIYLTLDTDFNNIQLENLQIINNIDTILEDISKIKNSEIFDNETFIKNTIKENIKLFEPYIIDEIGLSLTLHLLNYVQDTIDFEIIDKKIKLTKITDIEIFDVGSDYIGFNCKGSYQAKLIINDYDLLISKIEEFPNLKQLNFQKNATIFTGTFNTSIYYEYQFPYKIDEFSIEISEDEILTSIENK